MIQVNENIQIDERNIRFDFIRASGPGGQNVNKVATAVQLRFNVEEAGLSDEIRRSLKKLAGRRISRDGVLIIEAKRFRTQEQNRADAVDRLMDLIRKAAEKPKPRLKTRPTRASRENRLSAKKRRGEIKKRRQSPADEGH